MERALQKMKIESSVGMSLSGAAAAPQVGGVDRGLTLVNLDKPEVRQAVLRNPQSEEAYLMNSHRREHWYVLRRVGGMWFDLDSLKPAPQPIGNHELVHVLQHVMADGFTVFVIRQPGPAGPERLPALPTPDKFLRPVRKAGSQFYLTLKEIEQKARQQAQQGSQGGMGGQDDDGGSFGTRLGGEKKAGTDWASLGAGNTLGGAPSSAPAPADMDDDMRAAIAASLGDVKANLVAPKDEPPQDQKQGVVLIAVRSGGDPVVKRRFLAETPVREVFAWLEWANLQEGAVPSVMTGAPLTSRQSYCLLKQGFPKKEKFRRIASPDGDPAHTAIRQDSTGSEVQTKTLKELGFESSEMLMLMLE